MADEKKKNYYVPKAKKDYVLEQWEKQQPKKNYNDIVPKTRNYVEEEPEEKKNYDDIVPKTRSYLGEAFKRSIDNPYGAVEELESPPDESPRDLELEEGPLQTVPDIRESPDDPKKHQRRVEEKAEADILRQRQSVYDAISEDFTVNDLNSDMGYLFFDFIRTALEYGHSPEEVIAEIRKPEVYETLGIQPLGYSRSRGPDPFQQIRRRRERIAREAME